MPWSKVQIEMLGPSGHTPDPLGIATSGLDVGAEQMHEEFLADLPHLDEVRSGHARVVSDISEPIETAKSLARDIQPLDEMLAELGGSLSADRISIPLPSVIPDGLVLERFASEQGELVRLIAPERFGGILRQFALPEDRVLTRAVWSEGVLSLEII
tara:strand:- start:31 stop:501 length:471 start_codon:yes stop_codon:yes gene_type:complete